MAPPLVIDPPCVIEKLKSSSFFFDSQKLVWLLYGKWQLQ